MKGSVFEEWWLSSSVGLITHGSFDCNWVQSKVAVLRAVTLCSWAQGHKFDP